MLVAPNPLDFSKVFAGFKEAFQTGNVVVLFTILTLLVVYALLAVWAWRRDRLDYMQVGAPLLINHTIVSRYRFQIFYLSTYLQKCKKTRNLRNSNGFMYRQNCLSLVRRIRASGQNTFTVHKKKIQKRRKGKIGKFWDIATWAAASFVIFVATQKELSSRRIRNTPFYFLSLKGSFWWRVD